MEWQTAWTIRRDTQEALDLAKRILTLLAAAIRAPPSARQHKLKLREDPLLAGMGKA